MASSELRCAPPARAVRPRSLSVESLTGESNAGVIETDVLFEAFGDDDCDVCELDVQCEADSLSDLTSLSGPAVTTSSSCAPDSLQSCASTESFLDASLEDDVMDELQALTGFGSLAAGTAWPVQPPAVVVPGAMRPATCQDRATVTAAHQRRDQRKRAELAAEVKVLKQTVRRQTANIDQLSAQITSLKANANPSSMVPFDASKRFQSLATMTQCALRRNAGHTSLRAAAIWSGCAVSHTTIRKWEVKTAGALIAEARNFHIGQEQQLRNLCGAGGSSSCGSTSGQGWAVAAFLYKSDATNTVGQRGAQIYNSACLLFSELFTSALQWEFLVLGRNSTRNLSQTPIRLSPPPPFCSVSDWTGDRFIRQLNHHYKKLNQQGVLILFANFIRQLHQHYKKSTQQGVKLPTRITRGLFQHDFEAHIGTLILCDVGTSFQTTVCRSRYNVNGHVETCTIWPDVQPVIDKSAAGTLSLLRKQWRAVLFPVECTLEVGDAHCYRWILACTDAGSDQAKARKQLATEVNAEPNSLWADCNCFQHVSSNGNKDILLQSDNLCKHFWQLPYTYFSSLAKLSNSFNLHYKKIRASGLTLSAEDPVLKEGWESVRRLMPKPIAGRWGTSADCEKYLLEVLPANVFAVLETVLAPADTPESVMGRGRGRGRGRKGARSGKGKGGRSGVPSGESEIKPLDETAIEQCAFVIQTRRKYARETLDQLQCPQFWLFAEVSHHTRECWHHLHAFLMSDVEAKYGRHRTPLSVLVCGRAKELSESIDASLNVNWIEDMVRVLGTTSISTDILLTTIVTLTLANHGVFNFRVLEPLQSYPFALLRLCPDESPEIRVSEATRLLNTYDASQHSGSLDHAMFPPTARKFVDFHRTELEAIVNSAGMAQLPNSWMSASLMALRAELDSSTQDVESANKIITRECDAAPGEREVLIAARVTLKKSIIKSSSQNSRQLLANITDVAESAQFHYNTTQYHNLFSDPNRFVRSDASSLPPLPPVHEFNTLHSSVGVGCQPLRAEPQGPAAARPAPPPVQAAHIALPLQNCPLAEECDTSVSGLPPAGSSGCGEDPFVHAAWARTWNLKWARLTPKNTVLLTARYALRGVAHGCADRYWCVCSKHLFDGRLHELTPVPGAGTDATILKLVRPLTAISSERMLLEMRKHAYTNPVQLFRVELTWSLAAGEPVATFNSSTTDVMPMMTVWGSIDMTVDVLEHAAKLSKDSGTGSAGSGATVLPHSKRRKPTPSSSGPPSGAATRTRSSLDILKSYLKTIDASLDDNVSTATGDGITTENGSLEEQLEAAMRQLDDEMGMPAGMESADGGAASSSDGYSQ